MNKLALSCGENLVDEFVEVGSGNGCHEGTLKRKYIKRKGGGAWLRFTSDVSSFSYSANNSSSIKAQPRASDPGTRPVISKPTPMV